MSVIVVKTEVVLETVKSEKDVYFDRSNCHEDLKFDDNHRIFLTSVKICHKLSNKLADMVAEHNTNCSNQRHGPRDA